MSRVFAMVPRTDGWLSRRSDAASGLPAGNAYRAASTAVSSENGIAIAIFKIQRSVLC